MSDEDTEAMMTRLKKLDLDEMLRTGDGARLVERLVNTQAVLSTCAILCHKEPAFGTLH